MTDLVEVTRDADAGQWSFSVLFDDDPQAACVGLIIRSPDQRSTREAPRQATEDAASQATTRS